MNAPNPKDIADLPPEVLSYTNAPTLIAQTGTMFGIALVVVFARCYSRIFIVKSFGYDDWTMVLAMLLATVCFACYMVEISHGLGKYAAVIQADGDGYRTLLKARQVHMISIVAGIALVKVSVSFFLLRLATRRIYSWCLWGLIGFLITFTLVCMGTLIFQCMPVQAAWDVRLRPPPLGTGNAKCFSNITFRNIGVFNGVTNVTTDFMLALLPVPLIWKLQMKLRARISLLLILSLGIFAAATGIIRQLTPPGYKLAEPWIHDSYTIWNFVEIDTGIIAASLPATKPLFSWFYGAARNRQPNNPNAYKSPNTLGYRKQSKPSDAEGFVMEPYREGQSVKVTTDPSEKSAWDIERAKNSEESILPHHTTGDKKGGIRITREVQVE